MTDLHARSLTDIAADIACGALSSRTVTEHMLARIAEREPVSRAFVTVLGESALREADAADAALRAGRVLGRLHGVPVAIKDLLETIGVPTTCGTRVLADWRPQRDATVVRRLRAAGAVILGKTKLTEGAYGEHHPDVAPPVNPRRADLSPGVSSSGSGVAVADELCFAALGTDTGGSIRFPSSFNGIVGLKPSYGRVSRHGCFPLAESLDHIGPMARSVADAAQVYAVLAGQDALDPTSLDLPVVDVDAALSAPVATGRLRIGFDPHYASAGVVPAVRALMEDAVNRLRAVGVAVVPFTVPRSDALVDGWALTAGTEASLAHAPTFPARRADYGRPLAALLDLGRRVGGQDIVALELLRARFRGELERAFRDTGVDALLCPVTPVPTPTLQEFARPDAEEGDVGSYLTFTAPFNYSGHPTLTLPAGATADGRPLAVQLVAGLAGEARLICAGLAWEQARAPATR